MPLIYGKINGPKIDIIIPTFNRESVLERAINSVLRQDYQNFELYVIDDGSTDESKSTVMRYTNLPNFHYFLQSNQGVSAARNYGVKLSSSEWIAFLDSDDEWLPKKLSTQVKFLQENPQYEFIHSNEYWIRNGKLVNIPKKFDKESHEIFKRSLATCLISPSTVLIKRNLGQKFDFFDSHFQICEDYDLWLKILSEHEIGFIPEFLINKYGGHADQLSTTYPAMDKWRIRSLVNLFSKLDLSLEKKELVLLEIKKKAPILLSGMVKHQKYDEYKEYSVLLDFFLRG